MVTIVEDDQAAGSSEETLDQAILDALGSQIKDTPSPDAMAILRLAAGMVTDDNSRLISTSRLFYTAVITGLLASAGKITTIAPQAADLAPSLYAALPGSIAETTARAISDNPYLAEEFRRKLAPLFRFVPISVDPGQLLEVEFSPNAMRILVDAAAGGRFGGNEILSSIFQHGQGLLYSRMPMTQIADAVENFVFPENSSMSRTLQEEVDAAIAATFSFAILNKLRNCLYHAARLRLPGDAVVNENIFDSVVLTADNILGVSHPADASKLLLDSLAGPPRTSPSSGSPDSDPNNPVRFSAEVISLLRRAYDLQRRFFRNQALGAKGVVAAILTARNDEFGLDLSTVLQSRRTRFLDLAHQRLASQPDLLNKGVR